MQVQRNFKKRTITNNKGFTLIELMICLLIAVILTVCVFGVGGVIKGNFWYTNEGVLKELKNEHAGISEIVSTKRRMFRRSLITVKENGVKQDYFLDTNIFWNYTFERVNK